MSLLKNERVKMPPHCVKVPNGKHIYIHYTVRSYRNQNGKPTNDRVSIGKLDEETGMLIPNKRYYELFGEQSKCEPEYIRDHGVYAALSLPELVS